MITDFTLGDIFGGTFKKEPAFEYGVFTGYDLIFISANGKECTVAFDVQSPFAEFIFEKLQQATFAHASEQRTMQVLSCQKTKEDNPNEQIRN